MSEQLAPLTEKFVNNEPLWKPCLWKVNKAIFIGIFEIFPFTIVFKSDWDYLSVMIISSPVRGPNDFVSISGTTRFGGDPE